ncbi:MAG TPA: hypothetical protein VFY68_10700 [Nitrososphaeraceae archaeon]|nr:hypothetical protein [Nitrososphaeraceae archaeon]
MSLQAVRFTQINPHCSISDLGSRDEVIAVILEMLVSDCDFTPEQRKEIFKEIKKLGEETY